LTDEEGELFGSVNPEWFLFRRPWAAVASRRSFAARRGSP
jgi:hypothetical protein